MCNQTIGIIVGGSLLVVGIGGCDESKVSKQIARPAQAAMSHYEKGRDILYKSLAAPETGEDARRSMKAAVAALEGAVAADSVRDGAYACPLFRSRLAMVLLECGRNDQDGSVSGTVYDLLLQSVNRGDAKNPGPGCVEWIPGWIGLAEWAIATLDADANRGGLATKYLDEADRQLDLLLKAREQAQKAGQQFQPMIGGNALLANAQPKKDKDGLDVAQRLALLCQWLVLDEVWLDDTLMSFPGMNLVQAPVQIDLEALSHRIRTRIATQRAMLEKKRRGSTADVIRYLDQALRPQSQDGDENYFPARIEMADLQRKAGDYQRAEAWLRDYVSPPQGRQVHPAIANNPRLWLAAAQIYGDWYAAGGSVEVMKNGEIAFIRLLELDPKNTRGLIEYAKLRLCGVTRQPGANAALAAGQVLEAALLDLDEAREAGAAPAEIQQIAADIARAKANLANLAPVVGKK